MTIFIDKQLLDSKEASKYIGTTVSSLTTLRAKGRINIPYVKWGNRYKYKKEDLDAWIAEHRTSFDDQEVKNVQNQ